MTQAVGPRVQVTLQVPQTVYRALERITKQGERHRYLLDAIEQHPEVAAMIREIEAEETQRAIFEALGRKAAEQQGIQVSDE